MELIVLVLLEEPAFWNYIFPVNLLCGILLPMGAGLQIVFLEKRKKWYLLPLTLLTLFISCELLYHAIGTFDAFLFVFIGISAYVAFTGVVAGTLLYKVWTKVRH